MQIHMVFGLNGPASVEKLRANVADAYPEDLHFEFAGKPVWLVADDGLAREVSSKLGMDGEQEIAGLVTTVANYFGRANPDLWAWMKMIYEKPEQSKSWERTADAGVRVELKKTEIRAA